MAVENSPLFTALFLIFLPLLFSGPALIQINAEFEGAEARAERSIPSSRPAAEPVLRVFLRRDAYQRLASPLTVAEVFRRATDRLGPAAEADVALEHLRGGSVVVWRHHWGDDLRNPMATEVLATDDLPEPRGIVFAERDARS